MNCPLCGGDCQVHAESGSNAIMFKCKVYNRSFKISSSVEIYQDDEKQRKLNNLIFEYVLHNPYADNEKSLWWFYYEPTNKENKNDDYNKVNLAEIPYPKDISEKIDRILLNLYRINASYGYYYCRDNCIARAIFAETAEEENSFGIIPMMIELDYLISNNGIHFKTAIKGWLRIDDLLRKNTERKQAFIAMAFRPETECIRIAFRKGILEAGYLPLAIDEKEHNNQIVPEIFDEIDKSRFLVMDVTFPNNGAYYEAGYALGKGKQVIICCREEEFNSTSSRPHFDVAQKSMIVWKTEDELVKKLAKRIHATVK